MISPINVWDKNTFDAPLIVLLEDNADLIRNYRETENRIFLDHDLGHNRGFMRPDNPHVCAFQQLEKEVGIAMKSRTIRAFHYTRMTDKEVTILLRDGVHLSTPETLRVRLDALVADGFLTSGDADALYAASPFNNGQLKIRSKQFWMTSHPYVVEYSGVEPLMSHWGGEVASIFMRDDNILARLKTIGTPRIIELAILPVDNFAHSAGRAIISTFGLSLGCLISSLDNAFDLQAIEPLPSSAILAVHSEGDSAFASMGRGYLEGYTNDDDYYEKLTSGLR